MNDDSEVIAIFLDEGAEGEDAGQIDFSATCCLLRDAEGSMSIKPTLATDAIRLNLENSGVFRRATPIVDPVSGEVIGYELEEDDSLRVAVG
ncbi:MAG: hypothetical protein PVF63_06760 [Gammaproteobacteria bacterium]|jgi:hypothetical protein